MANDDVSIEETITAFHAAHDVRLASHRSSPPEELDRFAQAEREALYRHAEAIKLHAARLAKRGR
jgi:hypothetical protein